MMIMGIGWLLFSQVESTENVPFLRDLPFHLLPDFMQPIVSPLMFYAVYMVIALGQGLGGLAPAHDHAQQLVQPQARDGYGMVELQQQARRSGADPRNRMGDRPSP